MDSSRNGRRIVFLFTTGGGTGQMVNNLRDSGLFEQFTVELIVTHHPGSTWLRVKTFLCALRRYIALLVTDRVELVHVHMSYRGSFWRKGFCIGLAKAHGVPVVLHLHGSEFKDYYQSCGPVRRKLIRTVLTASDAVIALSSQWQDYLTSIAPRARVTTIHNFVDAAGLAQAVGDMDRPASSRTLLFMGLLGKRKGIYELVSAVARIAPVLPDVRLIAAGDGEIDEVRRHAAALGVADKVVLPGWVAGADKIRLLSQASVYVLPSHNEGLPVSILEAMACGLPIISTPVGGIPEAVRNGEEGLLVPPGDVDALAAALVSLLSDEDRARRMGRQARQSIEQRFSAASALSQIRTLYLQIGARPRSADGHAPLEL